MICGSDLRKVDQRWAMVGQCLDAVDRIWVQLDHFGAGPGQTRDAFDHEWGVARLTCGFPSWEGVGLRLSLRPACGRSATLRPTEFEAEAAELNVNAMACRWGLVLGAAAAKSGEAPAWLDRVRSGLHHTWRL